MIDEPPSVVRELDSRSSDGIDVALLWSESNGRLAVTVSDGKAGTGFVIDVRDEEEPLDVFRHPFAYAAWHRVPTDNIAQAHQQLGGVSPGAVGGMLSRAPNALRRAR